MWLIMNILYAVLTTSLVGTQDATIIDNRMTFLSGFSLFVASLVVFKFIFALLYTLKWNYRLWRKPYYRKNNVDVGEAFKKLKKKENGGFSSDEEDHPDNLAKN